MFNACGAGKSKRIFAAFNPTRNDVELAVPADLQTKFIQIADIDRFDLRGLENPVSPLEKNTLHLPRISLALWLEI